MKLISVRGTMCSGKTHVIKPFLKTNDDHIRHWDILKIYKEEGCINDKGHMDWDKWSIVNRKLPHLLGEAILALDSSCYSDPILIVESGTNQVISKYLHSVSNKHQLTTIELEPPTDEILKERAEQKDTSIERVLDFKKHYMKRYYDKNIVVTQEEASLIIKAKIEGIKIGIIGTAGRKEDGDKMSKELYSKMFHHAANYLNKLELKPEDIQLVSGGAAWADHVVVSLYLADVADNLTLHLPAPFGHNLAMEYSFGIAPDASVANYYHQRFSGKLGGSTLNGIARAIDKGASITVSDGLFARNLKVAQDSELLIAYTWGNGDAPKEKSGTRHTWDISQAKVKVHISLGILQGAIQCV